MNFTKLIGAIGMGIYGAFVLLGFLIKNSNRFWDEQDENQLQKYIVSFLLYFAIFDYL